MATPSATALTQMHLGGFGTRRYGSFAGRAPAVDRALTSRGVTLNVGEDPGVNLAVGQDPGVTLNVGEDPGVNLGV